MVFTLHLNGTGPLQGPKGKYIYYHAEMFTLGWIRDRYQGPLFHIVPVPFPVLPPVLFPCSVNKPLDKHIHGLLLLRYLFSVFFL